MRDRRRATLSRVQATLIAAFMALLVLVPRLASANGRLPGANQLIFPANDPNMAVLRTTFGILISRDSGSTWDWLCESSIPLLPNEYDPALGVTANGTLVATVVPGLDVSPDMGCHWSASECPFTKLSVFDVVVRPNAPHTILAVTSTPSFRLYSEAGAVCGATADAGDGGLVNQVFESVDDGAHWSALPATIDGTAILTALDVSATDPKRIYVSAFRNAPDGEGGTKREASLFVSMDHGASWTEHLAPIDPVKEGALYIAAVDPLDADRVYVRTALAKGSPSRLLVSSDGGAMFTPVLTLTGQMLGFALSPDGATIYAGSVEDGLFAAPRGSLQFEQKSKTPVWCLAARDHEVWSCSDEKSGFIAGVSHDDGATFAPKLHLCGIHAPITCDADAAGAACSPAALQQLLLALGCAADGGGELPDAQASDAASVIDASDAGAKPRDTPPSPSSCGCTVGARHGAAGFLLAGGAAAALALRRRRTRSRHLPFNAQKPN
jgi:hypothetical protein